jgi:superfamily II DNA/RNA helicase
MKVLSSQEKTIYPKCLVLSPTRELCQQIQRSIQELSPQLKCVAVYGGSSVQQQMHQLNSGCDIICATPGRLRDLLDRKAFKKEYLELICLDEADELLTPNFLSQIEFVLETDTKRQMLLFSATINKMVSKLVSKYMDDPEFIDLTDGDLSKRLPENVKHFVRKSFLNQNFNKTK